ncbi:hypothetical protein WA588_003879 [Blastocystis sp. NMH]
MKKASFCLLSLLLICAVFAEWDPVECTNKDVLKAIDTAGRAIKKSLVGVTYAYDHPLNCREMTDKDEKWYGLSLYGKDHSNVHYVHNSILYKNYTGDYTVKSLVLVSTIRSQDREGYPWEGILF